MRRKKNDGTMRSIVNRKNFIEVARETFIKAALSDDVVLLDRNAEGVVKTDSELEQALNLADRGEAIILTVDDEPFSIFVNYEERLLGQ